jgi:hypothetical protein
MNNFDMALEIRMAPVVISPWKSKIFHIIHRYNRRIEMDRSLFDCVYERIEYDQRQSEMQEKQISVDNAL